MLSLTFNVLLSCSVIVIGVSGYQSLQSRIPNGAIVPHPCTEALWGGVGHENPAGGGARNPFGLGIAAISLNWTTTICNADSDGDGKSNGEELGDPDCVWVEGATPARTTGLSHPGICEPVNSTECKQRNTFTIAGCSLGDDSDDNNAANDDDDNDDNNAANDDNDDNNAARDIVHLPLISLLLYALYIIQ